MAWLLFASKNETKNKNHTFEIQGQRAGSKLSTVFNRLKGALDKYNIIPQLFPKKVGIFIALEVLAWVMTACRVLRFRLTYF